MSINFPRLHIATSVVNRILNTARELETSSPAPAPSVAPAPAVPDPAPAGAKLDSQLSTPPGDLPALEPPQPDTDELAAAVARGDDLITAGR